MGLNLLIKPLFIFGIDRQIQNEAGPEAYGLYYAAFSFSLLGSMLLDAGLSNYNARALAQNSEKARSRLPALLGLRLFLLVGYLILTLTLGWLSGFTGMAWYLLLAVAINQCLNYTLYFFRSNLQGLQKFVQDGSLSVLDRALSILFCMPLLSGYSLSGWLVFDFALMQLFAYLLSTALAMYWCRHIASLVPVIAPKKQWLLLQQTLPFALLGIISTLYTRIDAVMLVGLLPNGHYEAGVYAAGYRLLDAFTTLPLLLSGILLPLFAKNLHDKTALNKLLGLTAFLLPGFGWLLGWLCSIYPRLLLNLLYTHQSDAQDQLFSYLMWTFMPIAGMYVFGSLLTAAGKLKTLNALAFAALTGNILLNLWLIPREGAVGAAVATLITQGLLFVSQLYFAWREYRWRWSVRATVSPLLFLLISGIGMWYGQSFADWTGLGVSAIWGSLCLLVLLFQRIKQLRKLVA